MDKKITENMRVCSLHLKRIDYKFPDAPPQKIYLKRDTIPSCNLLTPTDILSDLTSKNKSTEKMEFAARPLAEQPLYDGLVSIKSQVLEPEIEPKTPDSCIVKQDCSHTMQRHANEPINIDELMIKEEPEIEDDTLDMNVEQIYEYDCPESRFDNDTEVVSRLAIKDEYKDFKESEIKFETIDLPDINLNGQLQPNWEPAPASQDGVNQRTFTDDDKTTQTVCNKWSSRRDTLKNDAEKHDLLDNVVDGNSLFDSGNDTSANLTSVQGSNCDGKTRDESKNEGKKRTYKCEHCHKILQTKSGCKRHVAMHKTKPEQPICEICDKICASQARLVRHMKTHNKPKQKVQRKYLCHICTKIYPSYSSLHYHLKTHAGMKPHVCKICNRGFTIASGLSDHIRTHTGEKPFICHICGTVFGGGSAFRRHMNRHTGKTNYLCKTCGKRFTGWDILKQHSYTHSGEKPYVCKACGAAYNNSGSLFGHQKRCRVQRSEIIGEDSFAHSSIAMIFVRGGGGTII